MMVGGSVEPTRIMLEPDESLLDSSYSTTRRHKLQAQAQDPRRQALRKHLLLKGNDAHHHHIQLKVEEEPDPEQDHNANGFCSTKSYPQEPKGKPSLEDHAAEQQRAKRARLQVQVADVVAKAELQDSHWAQLGDNEEDEQQKQQQEEVQQERKEKKGGTRSKWGKEEIAALIKFRVAVGGETGTKSVWKEVGRRLGGLGYHRSVAAWSARFGYLASSFKKIKKADAKGKHASRPFWFSDFESGYQKLHGRRRDSVENHDHMNKVTDDQCDSGSYCHGGGPEAVKVESFSGHDHDENEETVRPNGTDSNVSASNEAGLVSQHSAEEERTKVCRGSRMKNLARDERNNGTDTNIKVSAAKEAGVACQHSAEEKRTKVCRDSRKEKLERDEGEITVKGINEKEKLNHQLMLGLKNDPDDDGDVDQVREQALKETRRAQEKGSRMMEGIQKVLKEMMERHKAMEVRGAAKMRTVASICEARLLREKTLGQVMQDLDWKELQTLQALASYLETSATKLMVTQDERERAFAESLRVLEQEERLGKQQLIQQMHERSQDLEAPETFLCKELGDSLRTDSIN